MAGNMSHAYITAHGEYVSGSHWLGEVGQIGVRVAFAPNETQPAKGATFSIMENGETSLDSGSATGTHGTLTRGFTARIGGVGSTENLDAALQIDMCEDMWTFLDSIKGYQHDKWRWTHIKIAGCDTDGKYSQPASIYALTTPLAVGYTQAGQPPEVALAVSLRAPVVGRTGRGRMYIPALWSGSALLDSDGTVNSTARTAIAGYAATLVDDLDDLPGLTAYAGITCVTSVGKSTAVRPTQVRVGNHFDAQRRRQHQVTESYTEVTL